jgi:tetratricopeptide (TPR) repeat protein
VFRLYPRDRRLLDLLIDAYSRMGRTRDAVELSVSRAELAPEDFYANVRAAQALAIWQGDQGRARPFVSRARTLATTDAVADRPYWGAWLSVTPAFENWLAGDLRAAAQVLEPLENGLNSRIGRERDGFASAVGFSYLALGRIQQAERAFRHASTPVRQINLAMLALAVGDEAQAREWLSQIRGYSGERPALFGRVGLTREAEHGLAISPALEHAEGIVEVTRGFVAAQRRDTESAIAHLRRGAELLRFSGEPEYFLAIEVLARTWQTRGQRDRATRLLAEGLEQRARTCGSAQWAGAFWIKLNSELLASYQQDGRGREAEQLSTTLRQLLSTADTDHPLGKVVQRIASADGQTGPGIPLAPAIEARRTNP